MKAYLQILITVTLLFAILTPGNAVAQTGNIDWETLWIVTPPPAQPDTVYNYFMRDSRQYTGLAYDAFRDVLYIVSPQRHIQGSLSWNAPRIYAWDANTGTPAYSLGRSCDATKSGMGGELPCPRDTLVPSERNYGYALGRYCIYKIDVDDEGRIYVCNLVNPIWGVNIDLNGDGNIGLPSQEEEYLKQQGPFRVWRWDTPTSTPVPAYTTLNQTRTGIGSIANSEMTRQRYGDAFDVIGKRGWYNDPVKGRILVDSTRIYAAGGGHYLETGLVSGNSVVDMLLPDNATSVPPFTHRLGVEYSTTTPGVGAQGIAATGLSSGADVWLGSTPPGVKNAFLAYDDTLPVPQTVTWNTNSYRALPNQLTGDTGPLKYFELKQYGRKLLICCDGKPTDPTGTLPNTNTSARILDVTQPNADSIVFNPTPQLGQKNQASVSAIPNYISAVDLTLYYDSLRGRWRIILFVLMSNNAIGCYRNRSIDPIELTSFTGVTNRNQVELAWAVATEKNNLGFEIMRSFSRGASWERIGFVNGRGTTTVAKDYTFSDPLTETHRSIGSAQYRLRQLDTDGAATNSPTVTVLTGSAPGGISLGEAYPNPLSSSTTIDYQLFKPGFVTLKMYNVLGREVRSLVNAAKEAGTHQARIDADKLPAGTYMYQLNVDGKTMQNKMVISK